jgi:hypothetical protein
LDLFSGGRSNFENELWIGSFSPIDDAWLAYILDNGVFRLERFQSNLEVFNNQNRTELDEAGIKRAVLLWMSGGWYPTLCNELELEMYQALRLVNGFISFNVQTAVSVLVRLKELKTARYTLPRQIANWSSFLQHGVDSQLKLDLTEMGLVDRIGVLALANYLTSIGFVHDEYGSLKAYLVQNRAEILRGIQASLPRLALNKLQLFFSRIVTRTLL